MTASVVQIHSRDSLTAITAANIRAEMARQRWSGRALAMHMGVSPNAMNRRLRGEGDIDVEFLIKVATVLNVDASDLLPKRKNAPHPEGPDGAHDASRLGESNPRPIHYKDRKASVVSLAEERARRNAAAEVERIEARA